MTTPELKKRFVIAIMGIVMVGLPFVFGTWAYLQHQTDDVINTFTFGTGVELELNEPKYMQDERRNAFTPGMLIDKDPTVLVPENAMEEEYIAVVVKYYKEVVKDDTIILEEISYEQFKADYATIYSFSKNGSVTDGKLSISKEKEEDYDVVEGIREGWVTNDNNVFYYGTYNGRNVLLTPVTTGSSITLFDKVKILEDYDHVYEKAGTYKVTKNGEFQWNKTVSKGQLVGFQIDVTAYAVQGNLPSDEGIKALEELLPK